MTDRTENPNPPIVVAVDGSAVSYQAAAWAAIEAALHGSALRIVHSISVPMGYGPGAVLTDSDLEWLRRDGERVIDEARRVVRTAVPGTEPAIATDVTLDPIIPRLLALSGQARMVVLGSRGLGALRRGVLGSVTAAVTRHAQCPVAVIRTTAGNDPINAEKPVLVGVDGSPGSMPALELAFQEASLRKVGLTALHAWSDATGMYVLPGWEVIRDSEDEVFAERLAGFGERYPEVAVRRILVRDQPARALLAAAEDAQLIVVGSHGRGGFRGMLLGSTSAAVLHDADCPVVVVRAS